MANRFATGARSFGFCDRCGQRQPLRKLKALIVKTRNTNMLVCPECWEEDHPQWKIGMYPVDDPQALRNPRPDNTYIQSGSNGEGSRTIQWGWNPVGMYNPLSLTNLPNELQAAGDVGAVTVSIA